MAALRVFLCYRVVDRPEAEGLAAWLRGMDVDVLFDHYQVRPGDDPSEVIARGLAACDAGVVLVARTGVGARWLGWQPPAHLGEKITPEVRLIVVTIDDDARVPQALRDLPRFALEARERLLARLRGGASPAAPAGSTRRA